MDSQAEDILGGMEEDDGELTTDEGLSDIRIMTVRRPRAPKFLLYG